MTLVVVALLAGTGYAFLVAENYKETSIQEARLDRISLDIDRLTRENRRLKLLIMNIKESDDLIEKIAREDAGLIKQGELLYIFPH